MVPDPLKRMTPSGGLTPRKAPETRILESMNLETVGRENGREDLSEVLEDIQVVMRVEVHTDACQSALAAKLICSCTERELSSKGDLPQCSA